MKNFVRINERINSYRVILIQSDGENKGEVLKTIALEMARKEGLDLVEVSKGEKFPICKILDYGKMVYEKNKREKHKNHSPSNKQIEISYLIGDHDLETKKKKIKEFIESNHKVLLSMKLKGREKYVANGQAAKEKFINVVKEFSPLAKMNDIQENPRGFSFLIHPS